VAEVTFFTGPSGDRELGVIMELAAEVYVLRSLLRRLEQALERAGTLPREDPEFDAPSPEERRRSLDERDALIARILAPLTVESDSPVPPFEPA
jgi:hypothetical protein